MDEGRNFPLPATQSRAWENQVKPAPLGRANGGRATFLTIVTADRAAQSRIFARSARECHPNARLVVVVPDVVELPRIFADLYDLVIPPEQLSLGGLADMRFRYSIAELCFALKPWAIRHLFDRFADEPIYYFDSDIEVFTPLAEVEAALAQGANLVLTPHILQPSLDQGRERALLRSGSFNAGFLAVAPSAPARAFVSWWCERVRTGCTLDPLEGTYGDQKWLELAPSICDGVAVLRHPGYNFAYWNAHERPLTASAGYGARQAGPCASCITANGTCANRIPSNIWPDILLRNTSPLPASLPNIRRRCATRACFAKEPRMTLLAICAPSGTWFRS